MPIVWWCLSDGTWKDRNTKRRMHMKHEIYLSSMQNSLRISPATEEKSDRVVVVWEFACRDFIPQLIIIRKTQRPELWCKICPAKLILLIFGREIVPQFQVDAAGLCSVSATLYCGFETEISTPCIFSCFWFSWSINGWLSCNAILS